ncbi:MAG: hypothetical protein ACN4G0_11680 [Polyangiales bacterium]
MSNPSASKKATSIASAITSFVSRINEQRSRRVVCAALVSLGLACVLPASIGVAEGAESESAHEQLRSRLQALDAREDAKFAKGSIEQARRALERASAPGADPQAVARAQKIAESAMVLADRQLARRRSQAELFATQGRLNSIRERAQAQRRALEALLRERARVAKESERP